MAVDLRLFSQYRIRYTLYLLTAAQLSGGRVGGNAQAPFGGVGALFLRASIVRRVPALSLVSLVFADLFARWA